MSRRSDHVTRGAVPTPGAVRTTILLVLAALVAFGMSLQPAAAQNGSNSRRSGSDDVDVLTASREEIRVALADIDARADEQMAAVAAADAEEATAREAVERARARVALAQHEVELAREVVAEYAVEAYIRPPATEALRVLSISRADDAAYASSVIKIMADERRKVVDTLVEKQSEADRQQRAADTAVAAADERANEAHRQLEALQSMRDEQESLAASLDDRLDKALAEAAALAEVDRQMADELAAQELALRSEGPATKVEVASASATSPAAPAVQTPTAPAPSPTPGAPGTAAPPTTAFPAPPTTRPPTTTPPTAPPAGIVTWADVVNVGGIYVHKSIAGNVQALLNAGNAAGLNLRGGGYRDPAAQIATRRANCGPTYYDIYEKPSNQCSPPTARPGRSMHERGLAIDFTSNGSLISSRSMAAFAWLQANAARYGLYNLPSEPWHWSTNGN